MIDKSLPRYYVYMYKTDTKQYPKYELPCGYSFEFYKKGDEVRWAELECSIGQFDSMDAALQSFHNNFVKNQTLAPEQRMLFVKDECGEYVATLTLWNGDYLGETCQRLHWLAVSNKCAGKGIAKALICRVLDLYNELGYEGFVYLLTATWYYRAIGIYKKFGFEAYEGKRSLTANVSDEEFVRQNREAIAIINKKLAEYKKA
ncbi:MAG: GNAT family N-acetyltransferase [Ruminococcaceae bacterium]|nr:GNAT family N-acetyltransferase [Oscillospiraceae bacterium]